MATGDIINAADYNNIRNKIIGVLGTGSGNSGYGQPIQSLAVSRETNISKSQWDALRFDIYNALIHQTGAVPSINEVAQGGVIRYGASHPVFQYDTLANQAITNRFNVGTGRFAVETGTSTSRTTAWTTSVSCTLTATFSTANEARFFFNSGGKIRFFSSRTGGTTTAQNTTWSTLLSTAGIRVFDSINSTVNFYNLTNVYQTVYSTSAGAIYSAYSANSYTIEARCDIANNVNGGARILTFKITWADLYTDTGALPPPDQVDGTLSLVIDQHRATGPILPSGNFTIVSPTYSLTSITGS